MNQRNNSKRKSTQIKRASITRKNEPPKKSKIINKKQREKNNKQKNNRKKNHKQKNNKKDKINKNENNSSGNIVQKNIIFNVNVIKSNNKKNKLSIKKKYSIFDNNNIINKNNISKENVNSSKKMLNLYNRKSTNLKSPKIKNSKKYKNQKINNDFSKYNDYIYKNLNDQELNSLDYLIAIELDNRTYFQYYWSLLKKKHLIFFTFITNNDYNLTTIKLSLFLIAFSLYFTINGFFFSDNTMHKVYEAQGKYNMNNQIPIIIYSAIITAFINIILKTLALSEKSIIEIKQSLEIQRAFDKSKKVEFCLKIKFFLYFAIGFIIMTFFWYYISCFCAVYVNTQIILIKDTLISFGVSLISPFGLYLFPGMFRIPALSNPEAKRKCLYDFSKLLQML